MRRSSGCAALAAALLFVACGGPSSPAASPSPPGSADEDPRARSTAAAEADLPRIHLIATGGTISNTDGEGRLTGDQIVESVPGIGSVVRISVDQFSNIASGRMTPELWLDLARRVESAFRERPELTGIVITHGTDTMEETAYFLDLVLRDPRPVVVTGAMRNSSRLSSDGEANLYNAARYLVAPESRGRGVMVVLNDVALPAREVTKMNTIRVETFEAGKRGPVAVLDPDDVVFLEPVGPRQPRLLDAATVTRLPRVDILFTYAGADGSLVDAAVEAGAAGLVLASVGRGGLTPGQSEAVERALKRGVYVAISSRTMTGRVPIGSDERRLEDWEPGQGVRFGANDLTPQKARILLMLALAATDEPERVLGIFRTY